MYPSKRRTIVMTLTPKVKPGVSLLSPKSCFVVAGLLQSVCTSVPQLIVLQRVSTGSSVTLCHMVLSARPRLTDLHSLLLMYFALMLFFSSVKTFTLITYGSTSATLLWLQCHGQPAGHQSSSLTDKWIIVIEKQPYFWQQMAELPEVRLLLQASNEAMTCE